MHQHCNRFVRHLKLIQFEVTEILDIDHLVTSLIDGSDTRNDPADKVRKPNNVQPLHLVKHKAPAI